MGCIASCGGHTNAISVEHFESTASGAHPENRDAVQAAVHLVEVCRLAILDRSGI